MESIITKMELREHPARRVIAGGVTVPARPGDQKSVYYDGNCIAYYVCHPGGNLNFINSMLSYDEREAAKALVEGEIGSVGRISAPPTKEAVDRVMESMGANAQDDDDETLDED